MSFPFLTEEDRAVIGACLHAAAMGPYFPDWELPILFGLERAIVEAVARRWPTVDVDEKDFASALIGSMNNLLGYPHGRSLNVDIGYSDETIASVLRKVSSHLR